MQFPRVDPRMALRKTQEGCSGPGGENPFPKAGPIFQQPLSLPENPRTLAGIAIRGAGKLGKIFSNSVEICRKTLLGAENVP